MIHTDDIAKTVTAYLDLHPAERTALQPLLASLSAPAPITRRDTYPGHVTCSAVLLNPAGRVLHIRHNTLGTWLRPGGHIEDADLSLYDAALRELAEETGIPTDVPRPLNGLLPVDIDIHPIPANPAKNEPEHHHYDLRYAFTLAEDPALTLQLEEVNGSDWLAINDVHPEALRQKIALLHS